MLLRRYHKVNKNEGVAPVATPSIFDKAPEEEIKEAKFSREEIEKMPFMKLKSVAKKYGIDTDGKDAKDIRAELIERVL